MSFIVAVALAAGTGWTAWRHAHARVSPASHAVAGDTGAEHSVPAPTAVDEGDLMPPAAGLDGSSRPRPHLRARHPSGAPASSSHALASAAALPDQAHPLPRHAATEAPRPASPPALPRPESAGPTMSGAAQAPPGRTAPPETAPSGREAGSRASGAAQPGPGGTSGQQGSGTTQTSPADTGGAVGSPSPAPQALSAVQGAPPRVTPPKVIATSGMDYPGEAFHLTVRRQDLGTALVVEGTEGTVALRALVLADGTVQSVEVAVSSGSPVLDRTAAAAVRRWRFAPATHDGVPIDAYVTLRIRYVVR